jgi:hypothetical protein
MEVLNIIVSLLFLAGGIWAIVYWLYPYMQVHTSNPILYTGLVIGGVFLVLFLFRKNGDGLTGMFFVGDLIRFIK